MVDHRGVRALEAALLETDLEVSLPAGDQRTVLDDRDVFVKVAGRRLLVRWLPVGWPRQVREALQKAPAPDVLAAPHLSPGARSAARQAGVGWVDETGAADIVIPKRVRVRLDGRPRSVDSNIGWRPATLAVCEVVLAGCAPTVAAVVDATGLAMSTVSDALRFLHRGGLLEADAARGQHAGRRVRDRDDLLDAYAAAATRLRSPVMLRVGVLWRDPLAGIRKAGAQWDAAGIEWAVTGALAAARLAPFLTEPTPLEVYVTGRTPGDLTRVAMGASLTPIDGGRLSLRPFPTPAAGRVTIGIEPGLRSVLWPRAYADLRTTGVRGEDAAEHLRTEMSDAG